ncbi:DUF433 domain-containing protein [Termitidicoccus mucosus]|uniref:DUF433 domain-containing protein n=2 Tax=Termitidicoccus mucosus TaxID=1184151 RepID=UPI002FEE0748
MRFSKNRDTGIGVAEMAMVNRPSGMILGWDSCSAVSRSPEVVGGIPVFKGTRVPVTALFENLEDGATVLDFLQWFPGGTKQQVDAVLEFAARSLRVWSWKSSWIRERLRRCAIICQAMSWRPPTSVAEVPRSTATR